MQLSFPSPVLSMTVDHVKELQGGDALVGLWHVFTKCKYALRDGERLENISWRLWHRERVWPPAKGPATYRPPTPDDGSPYPAPSAMLSPQSEDSALTASILNPRSPALTKASDDIHRATDFFQQASATRATRSMIPSPESSISSGSSSQNSPSPQFCPPVTLSTSPAPGPTIRGHFVGKIICECVASSVPLQGPTALRLASLPSERRRNRASKGLEGLSSGQVAIVRLDSSTDSSVSTVRIALPVSSAPSPKNFRIASAHSSKSSTPSSTSDRSSFPRVVVINSTPNRTPHPTPPATPTMEIVEPRFRADDQPSKVEHGDTLRPPPPISTAVSEVQKRPLAREAGVDGPSASIGLTSPVASPVTPMVLASPVSAKVSTPADSPSRATLKSSSDKRMYQNGHPSKSTIAPVAPMAPIIAPTTASSDRSSETSPTTPDTTLTAVTISTARTSPPTTSATSMRRSRSEGGHARPPPEVEEVAEDEEVDEEEEMTTAPSTSVHSAGHMKKLAAKHGKRIIARYPRHKRVVRRNTGSEKEKETQKERLLEFAARERESQERLLQKQKERERQEQLEKEREAVQAREREHQRREELRLQQELVLQREKERAAQVKHDAQEREVAAKGKLAEAKRITPRPDRPPSPSRGTYARKSRFDIGSPQSDDSKSTVSPAREVVVPNRPVIGGLAGLLHAVPSPGNMYRTVPPPVVSSPEQVRHLRDSRMTTAPAAGGGKGKARAMTEADVVMPRPAEVRAPTSQDQPPPNILAKALEQQGQRQQQQQRKVVQLATNDDSSTEGDSDWEDDEVEVPPPPPPPAARNNHPRRPPLISSKSTNNVLDAASQKLQRVQSDKDLFNKLPTRSYSNLAQQQRTGLLTQLMRPDPKIFEMRRTQTMADIRGPMAPNLYRPPAMEKSKSAAALPMSSLSTSQAVLGLDTKPVTAVDSRAAAPAAPQPGGYRPKGRPQNEDLESDTGDEEGGDRVELSQSVAQQRLAALVGKGKKSTSRVNAEAGPSRANDPQPKPQRRARIQPMTSVNPSPPSPNRSSAEVRSTTPVDPPPATPIPLGYPYNLPPPPEPSSPRTTRQLMLRTEMSESVRQNLLWSRQLTRRDNMGPPRTRSGILEPPTRPTVAAQPSVVRLTAPRQQDPTEQQREQEDIRHEMRLARNRTWAGDEYHQAGWW